ncbi:hypothetical protein [Thioalkalivibrio thiocyanodenitrificans]|uniref:hypothetical protein n=1 Tax=Thioalkalivibrio thiocyanodenitrificans TaxID=243063 RepID=UPI00035EE834|nr:hypothetical protein [Thioalkalivibrio thiocyanodenitrificans]
MGKWLQYLPGALLLTLGTVPLLAQVNIPYTFQAGDTARASEVNANFNVLRDTIESLQAEVAALQSELSAVRANNALALHDYVEIIPDPHVLNEYTVRFSGVNVQIVNGQGDTNTVNGLGNLIVGYNESRSGTGTSVCSNGEYDNEAQCTVAGHVWAENHKSGSHNIVGGRENSYSRYGGLIVGYRNYINRRFATVTGGSHSAASGIMASVGGGFANFARGDYSSILGGRNQPAHYTDQTIPAIE